MGKLGDVDEWCDNFTLFGVLMWKSGDVICFGDWISTLNESLNFLDYYAVKQLNHIDYNDDDDDDDGDDDDDDGDDGDDEERRRRRFI